MMMVVMMVAAARVLHKTGKKWKSVGGDGSVGSVGTNGTRRRQRELGRGRRGGGGRRSRGPLVHEIQREAGVHHGDLQTRPFLDIPQVRRGREGTKQIVQLNGPLLVGGWVVGEKVGDGGHKVDFGDGSGGARSGVGRCCDRHSSIVIAAGHL